MTLYAVGDLHGCLEPLQRLLDYVNFDSAKDTLWLTGDLVNRGPDSIGCLRFVKSLKKSAKTVLGNHDLQLITLHELGLTTTNPIIVQTLQATDAPALFKWLRKQPLLVRDKRRKLLMTHAGIPPIWSDQQAINRAAEFSELMSQKKQRRNFLKVLFGNKPERWHEKLSGHSRMRYIVNAFTRMRFCTAKAKLDFAFKAAPNVAPKGMKPWFRWAKKRRHQLIFGHWASLLGYTQQAKIIGLDTGYAWGNQLTMMNMDTRRRYCCGTDGSIIELDELEFECMQPW